jgi:acyl dehydratase
MLDVSTLTSLLREAEERHAEYEANSAPHHWSDWYAAYVLARYEGRTSDEAYEEASRYLEGLTPEQPTTAE